MSPPVSTATLQAQHDVLVERVGHIQKDLDAFKITSQEEIHELKAGMRALWKEVTRIEIKIAGWGVASGIITGVALKILDHLWK